MNFDKEKEEKELKDNISRAITTLLERNNMNQKELSDILGVDNSTVGKWINKKSLPRMGPIQKMADYFKVEKTYFLEDEGFLIKEESEPYYLNEQTKQIAQEAFENPNLRMLCSASRDLSPEDLNFVIAMIEKMKGKNKH